MSRVAVVTSHLTTGAAVSGDALGMCAALEESGYDARLFAESSDLSDPAIATVTEVNDFLTSPGDILIYHHSIGWEPARALLGEVRCRKVIKYHNITPASFFSGISDWHEQQCRHGRQQLQDIVDSGCDLYLSDSDYNQQELLALGVDDGKSFVVPPFHEIDRLHAMECDLKTLDEYRDGVTNVLSVGRVAPHKGHLDLIKAFAAYHYTFNQNSRLIIVGREEEAFSCYSKRLRELSGFLSIGDPIVYAGEVSDSTLRSFYLLANVFVSASEHEGFGVPFVEAMATKLPIVAYNSSAIPETVGSAGIVLDERDTAALAESMNLLITNEALNVAVGREGRRRYDDHFIGARIEGKFLDALNSLN
jgi:glycosyltransferase involved in cell wall biosynthesis